MKKSVLALVTVLVTAISIIAPTNVFAASVPNNIQVTTTAPQPGYSWYIDDLYVGTKRTSDGKVAYCLDYHANAPTYTTVGLAGEMDAGMAYIIENGFPTKSITGDSNKDYYITQVAIWLYLDQTAGGSNLYPYQVNSNSDVMVYAKNLVAGAKNAKAKGFKNPKISATMGSDYLSKNGDYFVSQDITVNTTDLDTYKVTLKNAPSGSFTTDVNGNKKDTFRAGEKFKVYTPVSSVNNTSTFEVELSGSTVVNKVYRYLKQNNGDQDILLALLYPETKTIAATAVLNIENKQTPPPVIVKVPNTSSNFNMMYIIGGTLMISGLGFVNLYAKKQNK